MSRWLEVADGAAYKFVARNQIRQDDWDDFFQMARLACWQADKEWQTGRGAHSSFLVSRAWNRMLDMLASAGYGQEIGRDAFRAGVRRETASLDMPVVGDESLTLGDTLADGCPPFAADVDRHIDIDRALGRISPREAAIIELVDLEGVTLQDVGAGIGVSESRVGQLRAAGLKKLRPLLAA